MNNETVAQPGTVSLSTSVEPGTVPQGASGGGTPSLTQPKEEPQKGPSIREALESESKRLKDEDAKAAEQAKGKDADKGPDADKKADPKAEKPADKTQAKADAKPADQQADKNKEPAKAAQGEPDKAAGGQEGAEKSRQSEGQKHSEAPARFLPAAREKWANVPAEVKADFHRITQEQDAEVQRYKAASDEYETVREFSEQAKRSGTDLKTALTRFTGLENMMRERPLAGLHEVIRNMNIRTQDGHTLTFYDIARHVARMEPEAYASIVGAPGPAQQGGQPRQDSQQSQEVAALRDEILMMKAEAVIGPVIEAFKKDHPDYAEREQQIAAILRSGVIDQIYGSGLSPEERLAEAYRMAGGNPPSRSGAAAAPANSVPVNDRPVDPDGQKSIKGAPNDGEDPPEPPGQNKDIRKLLRDELRKMSA